MSVYTEKNLFVLETKNTHYVTAVDSDGHLRHIYWGRKCKAGDYFCTDARERNSNHSGVDFAKYEYMTYGGVVYRPSAFAATFSDGCRQAEFTFSDFSVFDEDGGNRLEITLTDKEYGLEAALVYRIKDDSDVIERFVRLKNESDNDITLNKVSSGEFNFPSLKPYLSTNANGAWASEFRLKKTPVECGVLTYESRKGNTGHGNCPYFILSQNADEVSGDVYFGTLAWSGNFRIEISRDFAGVTRAVAGISDMDFTYTLKKDETFTTPSVFCGYTRGFDEMSNQINRYAVENILPKKYAKEPLPVLYNSWEATGFDVNCKDQLELAKKAAAIGCELFVMDDGWFGRRNDDNAGLGDWFVNKDKFPDGLKPLIDGVKALGMKFGLWFEPEMVNPDSDLFRAHPDWAYHYPTRKAQLLRNQLVLNMTLPEVQEYIFNRLDSMLTEYDISYIKWDMNRPFSETGAKNLENPQELWYRHVTAVYSIVDRLKAAHPGLQIESCSSGGGRAELGALSHYDMVWTSDNTDPVDRLYIQEGYSMLYPIKCMRAWVTDTNRRERPNDLDFRFIVSMQGSLSLGGNLHRYSEEEIEKSKKYVALYKEIRNTVQFGDFHRLANYENDGFYATQYNDESQSVVFVCSPATSFFNDRLRIVLLRGLESKADYSVSVDGSEYKMSGSYLMNAGISLDLTRPFTGKIIRLKKL